MCSQIVMCPHGMRKATGVQKVVQWKPLLHHRTAPWLGLAPVAERPLDPLWLSSPSTWGPRVRQHQHLLLHQGQPLRPRPPSTPRSSLMRPPVLSSEKLQLCLLPLLLRPRLSRALRCAPPVPQVLSNRPMSVATAAKLSVLGKTTPSTCSSTLGRSHISAPCVGGPSRYATTCSNIWSHTPVCEPSSVLCVPSASRRRARSMCTCAPTGLSVLPALPVARFSPIAHCWSATWQLTLHLDWDPAVHSAQAQSDPWTRLTPPEVSCSGVRTLSLPISHAVFPVDLGPRTQFPSYTRLASLEGTV